MQHVLDLILSADTYSWIVATSMAAVFTAFVSSVLGNFMYSFVFFPTFMAGGLGALAAFRAAGITIVPERSMGVIVESALGMMVALIAVLVVTRIVMMLYGLTIRPARQGTRVRAMTAR